jgi:phage tail-like protein
MPNFPIDGLKDPHVVHHFALELQGVVEGTFQECSGLSSTSEVIEHREQDPQGRQKITKIPGQLKFNDITLKRGVTDDLDLYRWRQDVIDGKIDLARKDGSVILQDQQDNEVYRFNFRRGWPTVYKSSDFKSTDNSVALEELTLAVEWIERA